MDTTSNRFIAFIKRNKVCLFLVVLAICMPTIFSLKYEEWLLYNAYLRPLYTLFSFSPIKAYWVHIFSYTLGLALAIWVLFCLISPDKSKEKVNWWSRIIQILATIIIVGLLYLFLHSTVKDAIEVYNNRYQTLDSDITHIEKTILRGRRGPPSNLYRINYTPADCNKCETKHLSLDTYQYLDLKKISDQYQAKDIPLTKVKLKLYYLPNSRQVVRYELNVSE